ncbi:Fic family protein [uncultured Mailhella sp.]|uniref:Fic family protein n=1 Tax=uncultured Mailhella sp. TaxID=1981031 RepID=UPI0025D62098|nr:Fic family protein [uncultured Mailhella sp.]
MNIRPFVPPMLPLDESEDRWGHFGMLDFYATAALAQLNGMMLASAKADLFWLTWLLKEAQSSNVIEGTVTTFDEILGENAGVVVPVERQDDVKEVVNYHKAMQAGLEEIAAGRPLTLSLVRALHALLLQGSRGEHKHPGQWRKVQVHIGMPGSGMDEATFIPPEPVHVESLLENWEAFLHRNDMNPIIQAAVMHAQFEMIHPFCDGNGRMGRLLITLFLAEKKVISKPCFYMSAYLQAHRSEYYSALGNISRLGDWHDWISFFLKAVVERSQGNINLLDAMNRLYEVSKKDFSESTASSTAVQILDYMFAKPVFTLPDIYHHFEKSMSRQGIMNIINKLAQAGIVEKVSSGKGRVPAIWRFTELMKLLGE